MSRTPASLSSGRTRWIVVGILALVTLSGFAWWRWSSPRLNVILVTFDTTRADRLGAYGYAQGLTQGFDEFASRGVVFERAYAPAPLTLPSHATMLTGLYPPEHGLRSNGQGRLDRRLPFLPELLKENGYDTGAFIAAVVLDSKHGLDRGFDAYDDDIPAPPQEEQQDHLHDARRNGADVMDRALAWLGGRRSRPFFCWIHLFDAHAPYSPREEIFGSQFVDRPYDAGVAWEVRQFARLTAFLAEQKLDANTLVVVVGDHGEGLDEHSESEHGMLLYNTTVRVPLAFVGPQHCRAGARVSEPVSLVDLTPTFLDLLRIPGPAHVSGRSLRESLSGRPLVARDCYAETHMPYLYNHWAPLAAVISERWKYIQTTRPELYDLLDDPGELRDRAGAEEDALQEMRGALALLQESFVPAEAENLNLSDNDREKLRALGYVAGGAPRDAGGDANKVGTLPDIKDMLPFLSKFDTARHLSMTGKLDGAIALLQEIEQATNEFPAAGVLLGESLAQAGRHDEAVAAFRSVLEKRPDFSGAKFTLGKLLSRQERFEEAVEMFRAYIRQDPEGAAPHFELGQALANLQRIDEAIAEFQAAVRLAPEFVGANVSLGQLLMARGRTREAVIAFERALDHDPTSALAHQFLMILLAQGGQAGIAIEHGRKAVTLDPESFEARFNFGALLVAQKRFAEALEEFLAAQKLRPDDPRPGQQIAEVRRVLRSPGRP